MVMRWTIIYEGYITCETPNGALSRVLLCVR
jgi:hypothetical protein